MRHAACLGLLLGALSSSGCWDFDALHKGGPPADLTPVPDLSHIDALGTCQKDPGISENCSNGIDDNNDCQVDCADPECANTDVCKPISPLGYGQLTSTTGATAPSCVNGTSQRGALIYENLTVPTTCSGCKCGQGCTAELRSYSQTDCMMGKVGGQQAKLDLSTGACAKITAGTNEYIDSSEPGCTADVSGLKPDPITFTRRDVLCLAGGLRADCTTPSCIKALLGSTGCFTLAGDVMCPSPFLNQTSGKTAAGDTRGCACTCAASGTATCTGTVQLFPSANCTGAGTALPTMACTPLGTGNYVSYPVTPSGLTCTPNQTQSGSLPQTTVTLCCLS